MGNDNLEKIVQELWPKAVATPKYFKLHDINSGGDGSMIIYRSGIKRGGWVDFGSPKSKRKSGDIIHLIAERLYNGDTWKAVEYLTWGFKS